MKTIDIIPYRISPMLATLADAPFANPDWIFEEKYDGVRMWAYKEGNNVSLISRNGIDRTSRYTSIANAVKALKHKTLALDGEIIALDARKISRFQMLQQGKGILQFAVFDIVYANGEDLRRKKLSSRRETLETLIRPSELLLLSACLHPEGLKAFQIAVKRGIEGVIGKNLSSFYVEGRSREWLKVKVHQEDEFVIGGFTQPAGTRNYFGALLLGAYSGGKLRFMGKVGTGFDEKTLASLYRTFQPLVRTKSPFSSEVREPGATYLSPRLVAQISYTEQTSDGKLRHPVYLGLRDDKDQKEVVWKEM
ncbi:MAG TPA: non-homologous end-joining DNA ligase [Mucilaginibacter sp.]|jgi:bifunctional non-homologous end joining protein LigD|nr:non-homologous end-joining DNA ligase [Mucilaginibacter sp.]